MMYWTGEKAAIEAANAMVSEDALGQPEYALGQERPAVTRLWAEPRLLRSGAWAIPAVAGMAPPRGCILAEQVLWPLLEEAL